MLPANSSFDASVSHRSFKFVTLAASHHFHEMGLLAIRVRFELEIRQLPQCSGLRVGHR